MNAETSNRIKDSLTIYAPCIILVIGNIGCLLNLITFTFKQLRANPCGWYFLMSAIADIWIINFGLITKLSMIVLAVLCTVHHIHSAKYVFFSRGQCLVYQQLSSSCCNRSISINIKKYTISFVE